MESKAKISAAEREQAFRKDFAELCSKHYAEIIITDDGSPYGLANAIMRITMMGVWEGDEQVKEFCEFNL